METVRSLCVPLLALTLSACGDSSAPASSNAALDDTQRPPLAAAEVSKWLERGHYKAWKCQSAPHAARAPSPHGQNRICSNGLLSGAGDGEYPVDSASVKELWDSSGQKIIGHAVYRHTKAGKSGDAWYWFERADGAVVADGFGDSGAPKSVCVACHEGAGSNSEHSGHDYVYTQVK